MAQICVPSKVASSEVAGGFKDASVPAFFQLTPWSLETRIPPAVAANQASLPKVISLTCTATKVVGFLEVGRRAAVVAVVFLTGAPFLPLAVVDAEAATGVASGMYRPAFTHFLVVSSYFIQPPLFNEAHQVP